MKRTLPEILILLLLVGIHLVTLSYPPSDPDVGDITYNGMLLNHGMVPYRDSFEQKFPVAFFLAGGVIGLFGTSVTGFNVVGLFCRSSISRPSGGEHTASRAWPGTLRRLYLSWRQRLRLWDACAQTTNSGCACR